MLKWELRGFDRPLWFEGYEDPTFERSHCLTIVLWCNGSITVFGTVGQGSNPCGTTNIGVWCNGSTGGFEPSNTGSTPVIPTQRVND